MGQFPFDDEVLQEADIEEREVEETNIMTTEEVAATRTAIDTGIGVEKTIGEAHTESGEADQGAHLHLEVDFADLGQEGGMLDPTVLRDDHQSIRQKNKNGQSIDPFNELMNRISLRRMNLEEIFEMKTTSKEKLKTQCLELNLMPLLVQLNRSSLQI